MSSPAARTIIARVYVLAISNQLAHVTRDALLRVSLRIEGDDVSFGNVHTTVSKMGLFDFLADTTPQLVAFEIEAEGFVTMRHASHTETLAFRPPTPSDACQLLRSALADRPLDQPRHAPPRAAVEALPKAA